MARGTEATQGDNALGIHINEQGETVFEELTPEQYEQVAPFWYHWREK